MAKILLQTTVVDIPDDWNVARCSLLAEELRRAGHEVTARHREQGEADPVLSVLDRLDYDQVSLMAVDTGDGLSPDDAAGIMRFRARGGGMLTARDHQDLGPCLLSLGSIGQLNHFHNQNPEPDARRDDEDNPKSPGPMTTPAPTGTTSRYSPRNRATRCYAPADSERSDRVVPPPPPRGRGLGTGGVLVRDGDRARP